MKYTLTRAQLDGAKMVGGKRKSIGVVIDGEIVQLGHSKICEDTKRLIVEEYPHLIKHDASTYDNWSCRCSRCKAAQAVYKKPYNKSHNDERRLIEKAELKDRIMDELNLSVYECSNCQSKTNLEYDHKAASNKLMDIDSFRSYLNKSELQDFISAELKRCQIICKTCHNKSLGPDQIAGRERNKNSTPWLKVKINGKRNYWNPTQIVLLLKKLGYSPGDAPRPLTPAEWEIYKSYAKSIGKLSIESPFER